MRVFLKNKKPLFTVKSYWFSLIAALYFGSALNMSFWRFIIGHLSINGVNMVIFAISILFLVVTIFYIFFNIFLLPRIAKPILALFLIVSSAANYYMYSYGIYIDADMITNIFETNTKEAFSLITMASFLWVFVTGVIPAVLLAFVRIEYKTFQKELKVRVLAFVVCIAVVGFFALTSYKEYASFGRNNRQAQKLINTFNYIYGVFRYFNIKAQAGREFVVLDDNPVLSPYEDPLNTVIIFIVGETARAKNFSLGGYEKETNPLLSKQDIIFNKALSCGTSTAISVPCLFSNLNRSNFDKNSAKYTENFLDIAQKSGYRVIWKENDGGCKDVCNRVESEDMVRINNPKYCRDGFCQDEVLLDGLEEMLMGVKNNTVIALHTMGSHGPTYFERYPERFKVFTPTCDTAEIQNCPQEAIANTYDNTIVYTDFIISSAIDILKKFPNLESGLIYISDHGENLGENNIYLHGLPYMIAPKEQTEIPMVIWMSENMKKYDYINYECLRKEAADNSFTQDNIFHTMMGWLEIDTKAYDEKYDIFNSCRIKNLPFAEQKR